jgi:CheY-like chemotaxis protein
LFAVPPGVCHPFCVASDFPFEVDGDASDSGSHDTLASAVLIVDDEPVVRDVFSRLLEREEDLVVVTADSAEAALNHLRNRRFDLLITDKNLPGLGGIELVSEALRLRPGIESIVITGYASAESVLAAFAAGASDYLTKPFEDLALVRAKIRAALERREQRGKDREVSRAIAKQVSELLAQGKLVPDPVWDALEKQFALYEAAIKDGGKGAVLVIGSAQIVSGLWAQGFEAMRAEPNDPQLEAADVVVIDTAHPMWRPTTEKLMPAAPDVLLLARPDADLGDLLEAISMRVDLVGFGSTEEARRDALPGKLKGLLMRRAVQRAQAGVSKALDAFRDALKQA